MNYKIDVAKQIDYWVRSSTSDIGTSKILCKNKKYLEALFFAHLSLEKALKAHVVKKTEDIPPYSHNLILLAKKGDIKLANSKKEFLAEMNRYQIQGRYPDDRYKLSKTVNYKEASNIIKKVKEIREWLIKKL